MDTQQLTAFLTVAETGSFTGAAAQLHLTQPAISKRIALLEEFLGNRLFDRIGKQVKLTEAGQVLMPHAQRILREIDDTRNAVSNLSGAVGGRLALAASHHVGLHRLPPVLKAYSVAHPDVHIDISFLDSEQAYSQVRSGGIELAVVTLATAAVDRIVSETLWVDELVLMTSVDHPLAGRRNVQLSDLLDYPAILPGPETYTRQLIDARFREAGLTLAVEMSTNYLETIKMMVSVGMAWSVLPSTMQDQSVTRLPVRGFALERELGFIHHRDHTLSNAAYAFMDVMREHRE